MKRHTLMISFCALVLAVPAFAGDKKHNDRAMIEKMEAVPCGAKERGLTGLGSVFGSIGATHVDSDEKLCPQYMLRTDEMEYHIRPLNHKHPVILPVGKEGEFRIFKDVMEMRIPDGDRKKRRYQVIAMKPVDHSAPLGDTNSKYEPRKDNYAEKPLDAKAGTARPAVKTPTDPTSPPQ
ncbi:MAG TPA: hypothetical protein VGM18_18980 [Candidatus Sulfotelmatobacter sp.]|jgi:hypothetical protein